MSSFIANKVQEFFFPSVNGVLETFTRAQAKLKAIHTREANRALRLQQAASCAQAESNRAFRVSSKLSALTE